MHKTIEPTILYFGTPVALSAGYRYEPDKFGVAGLTPVKSETVAAPRPYIDPARSRPLMVSFFRFFGVAVEVHTSPLAESGFMKFVEQGMTREGVRTHGVN